MIYYILCTDNHLMM